ncbi:MAG: cytochrome c biogenesis protein CcdA [Oligoflexia bacterium]
MDSILNWLSGFLEDPSLFGMLGAFAIAYLGGVLSSLTPCVYPMIPITVSVIGGTASKGGAGGAGARSHRWRDVAIRGAVYVSGMAVVYAFLGVLAGLTGRVFGTLTQSSGWYLFLGIVFSLGALVMLGVLPFDPMAWWDRLARKFGGRGPQHPTHAPTEHREITLLGAFSLGASSGFIASPCTTPILTAILAFIAKTQSVGLGLFLMLAFALGIGTLLLLIAFFTGFVQFIPRSGVWMERVKLASGLLLLGVGHYLVFQAGNLWQAR